MAALLFVLALFATFAAGLLAQVSTDSLPRFVVEPRDTTVQTGRTAQLECQVSSLADNQAVAWMKEATFQTSGRSLLTTDPEKLSRITVEDGQSKPDLNFNLFIHNVRPEDAGVYHCYVVEFRELERRWSRSKPAMLTVVDVLRPSVRCLRPTVRQLSDAASLDQPAPVGCTVLNNQPGMVVKLRNSHGVVLVESETNQAEPYNLRFQRGVAELRMERMTCLIEFRDETSQTGQATRSCSMGPFIELPPAGNRTRITVDLVSGSDAHLSCPANEGHRRGDAVPGTPSWKLEPQLPVSRYSLSHDGITIVISQVTSQDEGLVVSCKVPNPGGGYRVVDMEVRVRNSAVTRSRADHPGQQVHEAGGSRDRSAPKPVIGQAAWSVLRGRVSTGRLKPVPPSSNPGQTPDIHRAPAGDNPPRATLSLTVPTSRNPVQDPDKNGTSTSSAPTKDPSPSESTATPVTDPSSSTLSPLIIVALCEAGMSLVILVIAFAVLCQCCCRNQTKTKVRGDKDLTLASASFGKQSTTPTLINYKSTAGPGVPSPDLSQKKLPPLPTEPIYARPESVLGGKKLLRESDLPPTGSWVFSSVNSENGEAETNTREAGNEIYVTMV
ncbi:tyrosine-protein phosphatase non-receptor type substrate 1-like [Patiria miniata]|uniref:Ig-like domain-containing protein n=1 Tax=Patiria miniata TaxID=46514 RepID=A0A914A840_PATMI|nr:tyrosine-protein phosphatase non-receptor type substrate 1-like [Patiria miniata]